MSSAQATQPPTPDEPTTILQAWLERVYEERLTDKFDAATLVLGGEGVGKSTLMLELIGRYQRLRGAMGDDPVDSVLDRIVWSTREEFKDCMSESPTRSAVAVPDAARVLHKKEAMAGEQVELEKDLLDVRGKQYLMLFGYQDWGVVPSILQERRAHFCLRIPHRGRVEGYSRAKLDTKYRMERDDWPEPDFVDAFPNLEQQAPRLWAEYERRDMAAKEERMAADTGPEPEEAKKDAQRRTAIRAVERHGLSYEEASRLVDYSDSWVGNQVRDYRAGEIDPFGDDDDSAPAPGGD